MKILKPGRPELKGIYSSEHTESRFPSGWWIGARLTCECDAVFELEAGDAEERPEAALIQCPHCKALISFPRGYYPFV